VVLVGARVLVLKQVTAAERLAGTIEQRRAELEQGLPGALDRRVERGPSQQALMPQAFSTPRAKTRVVSSRRRAIAGVDAGTAAAVSAASQGRTVPKPGSAPGLPMSTTVAGRRLGQPPIRSERNEREPGRPPTHRRARPARTRAPAERTLGGAVRSAQGPAPMLAAPVSNRHRPGYLAETARCSSSREEVGSEASFANRTVAPTSSPPIGSGPRCWNRWTVGYGPPIAADDDTSLIVVVDEIAYGRGGRL